MAEVSNHGLVPQAKATLTLIPTVQCHSLRVQGVTNAGAADDLVASNSHVSQVKLP